MPISERIRPGPNGEPIRIIEETYGSFFPVGSGEVASADPLAKLRDSRSTDRKSWVSFPDNYELESGQWALFSRYEYTRPSAAVQASFKPVQAEGAIIALPVPHNLTTGYTHTWDDPALGLTGAAIRGQLEKTNAIEHLKNFFQADKVDEASIKGLYKELGGKDALWNAGSNIGEAWLLDRALDQATPALHVAGIARNPWQALVYQAPTFRAFNFAYKLIAKSQEEADSIQKIIRSFKEGQHPTFEENFNNNLYKYPDIFHIQIYYDANLFRIGQCALKDFQVNYHDEGVPAYFKGKYPFSVGLQMTFQEMQILTREDIQRGF